MWFRLLVVCICMCSVSACLTSPDVPTGPGEVASASPSTFDWKPRKPLPQATMSAEERDRLTQEFLARAAKESQIEHPPQVAAQRWIYPEEIGAVWVPCMQKAGFNASSSAGGRGYVADMGSLSQKEAFDLAVYKCKATYPLDPRADNSTWTRAQHEVAYEYLTTFLIPCLRKIGANPADAPSLAVYLSDPGWEYPDPGSSEKMELWYSTCPIDPPTAAILGDS